ncbi:MAG: tRNA dihydrouridine synthase DusB [Acidimicrobiia bacterium]
MPDAAPIIAPLQLGPITVDPPMVLAPMAGVTNAPFRALCREFAGSGRTQPDGSIVTPGLFVNEMVMARAVVEGNGRTDRMLTFAPDETPRSIQLYAIDPEFAGRAAKVLVSKYGAQHIDLNFGCPAAKVTRNGGGAAVPAKPRLLARIVAAVVAGAEGVPVTMKFRVGLDDSLITYLDAGRVGAEEGCAAIALHARTAEQHYAGSARWDDIAALKAHVTSIPVLGNGDIWEANDALRMMSSTGCDGVVVGRGCLGRPWMFGQLASALRGDPIMAPPKFAVVADVMRRHAAALEQLFNGIRGVREFRKHCGWYTTGYPVGPQLRRELGLIDSLEELDELLSRVDPDLDAVPGAERITRGHTNGPRPVHLPDGFLDHLDDDQAPGIDAELAVSGG